MPNKKLTIKRRLDQDENFILKVLSEVGDVARVLRGIIAKQKKLERRMSKYDRHLNKDKND